MKQLNPEAYKPLLISIGPVFHGQLDLQPMEQFKKRYANKFMKKYEVTIQELINITEEYEELFRKAYEMDSSEISSHDLAKIMIIDGAFLAEFLCRHRDSTYDEMDRMTHKKWNVFKCDLFLLENQIPYFYLHQLLSTKRSLSYLLFDFVKDAVIPHHVIDHFLEWEWSNATDVKHFLNSLRKGMDYTVVAKSQSKILSSASCPTIFQLHRAGIKFRPSSRWSWNTTITFRHETLELPQLIIDENTARYFANLIALEVLEESDRYATDFIAFMDYLIDGPEDVKILVESGIVQNYLEDDKAAASLINEIGRPIDVQSNFRYSDLVNDLNAHCQKVWIKWKSTYLFEWKRDLKRNYFSTPWKTLSVIAAIILLGLTVAQTVFAFLQLKAHD